MKSISKIEIYSRDWCPFCRKAKAFFSSKGLSFDEYDIVSEDMRAEMVKRSGGRKTVPQVFINGKHIGGYDDLIEMETSGRLGDLLNVKSKQYDNRTWDLVIVGAGPAGVTAAVYAARAGIDLLLLSTSMGGQVLETDSVENYIPHFGVSGAELMEKFWRHANRYDISSIIGERVNKILSDDGVHMLQTDSGKLFRSKAVIIASGTHKRNLGVPGENKFKGKGVHYCSICDGYLYAGKPVAVAGGGNSGMEAAIDMARLASRVSLIEIYDSLTGDKHLQKKVHNTENIEVLTSYAVKEVTGNDTVKSVVLRHRDTGKQKELDVSAVFVEIGLVPNSGFCSDLVKSNENNEIIINENNETNVDGIFAAGDVTSIRYKQIVTASAEGAKAALSVNEYSGRSKTQD